MAGPVAAERPAPRRFNPWPVALGLGLLAGLAAFGAGEAIHARYAVVDYTNKPEPDRKAYGANAGALSERQQEVLYARDDARLCYGVLGALLGLGLGLAGGLSARSSSRATLAGAVGLLLGGLAGGGVSHLLLDIKGPIYAPALVPGMATGVKALIHDLQRVVVMHAAIWGTIGAAAGLAFGIGRGGPWPIGRGLVGGLLGGVLAAVLYNMLGSFALPSEAETFRPVAQGLSARLAAHLAVALLVAACVCLVTTMQLTRPRPQQ